MKKNTFNSFIWNGLWFAIVYLYFFVPSVKAIVNIITLNKNMQILIFTFITVLYAVSTTSLFIVPLGKWNKDFVSQFPLIVYNIVFLALITIKVLSLSESRLALAIAYSGIFIEFLMINAIMKYKQIKLRSVESANRTRPRIHEYKDLSL